MTFAAGVLPHSIRTGPGDLRTAAAEAIALIDCNPRGIVLTPMPATEGDVIEIVFALPASTRFDRFAVPNIRATPSAYQTFAKNVEVSGASESQGGPYTLLAEAQLSTHADRDDTTKLTLAPDQPDVLFVRVRLSGGVDVRTETIYLEFSELVGNGAQWSPTPSRGFDGVWEGRGVGIELAQDGPSVIGRYDGECRLSGTIEGKVPRALGGSAAGIASQFILLAADDGALRGSRSTNGATFKPYDGEASSEGPACLAAEPPALGCGSIVHGICFDVESDVIRPESEAILAALFSGLSDDAAASIEIIGRSSSEGAADYNRDLSERRAGAVVAALVGRGLDASTDSASRPSEDEAIARNDDEARLSLNRRVEIVCDA